MNVWNNSDVSSWFRLRMIMLIILLITPTVAPIASVAQSRQIQTSDVAIVTTENGEPFYDACFELVDYSIEGCDVNRDGKITFEDIPLGSYILRQTRDLGPGRHVTDSTISVTGNVASDGWERFNALVVATGTSGVENGSGAVDIALITRDPQDGRLLTSTCYVLLDFSNEGCDENGDGQVTFAAIPYGDYTVRQTLTPSGYPTINDFTITVQPVRGPPGESAVDVPLGFVVKQASDQNTPGTRNVSVVLIDATTHDKVVAGACVELVGVSLIGCDEDLLDGQIDFLDVREGGPYELRFSNLLPGTNARTIDGAVAVTIDAGPDAPSSQMIFILLDDQRARASIVPTDSTDTGNVVGDGGFSIELDGVTVSGSPDVAPFGTAVRAQLATHDLTVDVTEFAEPVGTGVEVILGDGVQPSSPITITFVPEMVSTWGATTKSDGDHLPVIFASNEDGSGLELANAQMLPDGSVEVAADHLSWYQPALVSVSRFTEWTGEQVSVFLQLRSDEPDCFVQTLEHEDWQISSIPDQVIWPCIEQRGDEVEISLTNNGPVVWFVESDEATPGLPFILSPVGMLFASIVLQSLDKATTSLVIPSDGSVTFNANENDDEILLHATLSAPLTVINATMTALLIFVNARFFDELAKADCLLDLVSTAIESGTTSDDEAFTEANAGSYASTIAGCMGTILGLMGAALGGALFSAIADAPGALAANLQGIYLTATGNDSFPITVSKIDAVAEVQEDRSSSSGLWPTDRDDSVQGLYTWIGASSAWPDTGISGMPDWVACDDAGDYCLLGYTGEDHILVETDGFDVVGTIADWYPDPKEALLILGMTEEVANQILGID